MSRIPETASLGEPRSLDTATRASIERAAAEVRAGGPGAAAARTKIAELNQLRTGQGLPAVEVPLQSPAAADRERRLREAEATL